jgi:uncharacterized membrane protein
MAIEEESSQREYELAKSAYDAAERSLAMARHRLLEAEKSRNKWWQMLVDKAAKLSPEGKRVMAEKQFGPIPIKSMGAKGAGE